MNDFSNGFKTEFGKMKIYVMDFNKPVKKGDKAKK
jgi:hypothetical protein